MDYLCVSLGRVRQHRECLPLNFILKERKESQTEIENKVKNINITLEKTSPNTLLFPCTVFIVLCIIFDVSVLKFILILCFLASNWGLRSELFSPFFFPFLFLKQKVFLAIIITHHHNNNNNNNHR